MASEKCWKCSAEITGTEVKFCSQCGSPHKKPMSLLKVTGLILLGFVVVFGVRIVHDRSELRETKAEIEARATKTATQQMIRDKKVIEERSARDEQTCTDTLAAFVLSQDAVESSLKAPSSAKFPRISDPGVRVRYLGKCVHEVTAYVDAQNGFGANLRTQYVLTVKNAKGTDNWTVLKIKFM